jgi:hypothetical protein
VHRAAGAAVLRPADDTSGQTAPNATEISEDITAESQPEVALLAYLQEEQPRARRRLSRTSTIRAQLAALAAGLTATQANGHPEAAPNLATTQPAAASPNGGNTYGGPPKEQSGKGPPISHRKSDGRFSTNPEIEGSVEIPTSGRSDSSEPSIRRKSRNPEIDGSGENPTSGRSDSSEPSIRKKSRSSEISQKTTSGPK